MPGYQTAVTKTVRMQVKRTRCRPSCKMPGQRGEPEREATMRKRTKCKRRRRSNVKTASEGSEATRRKGDDSDGSDDDIEEDIDACDHASERDECTTCHTTAPMNAGAALTYGELYNAACFMSFGSNT